VWLQLAFKTGKGGRDEERNELNALLNQGKGKGKKRREYFHYQNAEDRREPDQGTGKIH